MSPKIYLRVDVRSFAPGDIIPPGRTFMQKHKPKGTGMEELLASTAPTGMPARGDQLFVFEEEPCAHWYLAKTTGGRLYRVSLEDEIVHRGDMNLLDEIGESQDEAERKLLAEQYWRGELGAKPCVEVMVPKARVMDEIVLTAEQIRDVWAAKGLKRVEFEKESIEDLLANGLGEE
jgi:hypothetical protein